MEAFIATIFMFAGNFPPRGFAFCDGQILPISQNAALFSIIGTTYGGNGTSNFALPDLRGRVPIHPGQGAGLSPYVEGQFGGSETVTLTTGQLPSHSHSFNLNNAAGTTGTPGATLAFSQAPATGSGPNAQVMKFFTTAGPNTTLVAGTVGNTGGGTPVNNLQPYLSIYYIITLEGIYPSRN